MKEPAPVVEWSRPTPNCFCHVPHLFVTDTCRGSCRGDVSFLEMAHPTTLRGFGRCSPESHGLRGFASGVLLLLLCCLGLSWLFFLIFLTCCDWVKKDPFCLPFIKIDS